MTPSAILAATIEIMEQQVERSGPLDLITGRYLRQRRYIGSKDRSSLMVRVFGLARRHFRIGWRLEQAGAPTTPRARVIADLVLTDDLELDAISALFNGEGHAPRALDSSEWNWLLRLGSPPLETSEMPAPVRLECPDWAWDGLNKALGEKTEMQLHSLLQEAPLDLRVNTLKTDTRSALNAIKKAGFPAEYTPLSVTGIRLEQRVALGRLPGLLEGSVDPQDEGSQLAAAALNPQPGERIADFCAGAGGKTLAMAASMRNKGRILALDDDQRRLDRAAPRLAKAGVDIVERRLLTPGRDTWLKRQAGKFDGVLIDAPCSGVGAWRRNPDARWGRGQPDLASLTKLQSEILDRAARLVKPGGRLVYVTCSLIPEENELQTSAFLSRTAGFSYGTPINFPVKTDKGHVTLTPSDTGTDGFFIAWLNREI